MILNEKQENSGMISGGEGEGGERKEKNKDKEIQIYAQIYS